MEITAELTFGIAASLVSPFLSLGLTMADLLAINAGVVGLLILSFFTAKTTEKGPLEKSLNQFSSKSSAQPQLFQQASGGDLAQSLKGQEYSRRIEARMKSREHLHQSPVIVSSTSRPRDLNVFFNWNGHSWDAFEVLGLPAGARGEQVLSQFKVMKNQRPDAEPFLQAAVDAILKRS